MLVSAAHSKIAHAERRFTPDVLGNSHNRYEKHPKMGISESIGDAWLQETQPIYTMEYYSAFKRRASCGLK